MFHVFADSYDMARFRARKAQETSHVEDSDGNGGRKVIPPRRFRGINSCCNTNCKLPCKFIMIGSININFFYI